MKRSSAALFLLLVATPALAQSNIGLSAYPAPKCDKPAAIDPALKPAPPPNNPSNDQAEAYNAKVQKFNTAMRARNEQVKVFDACMQAYVAAGNADLKRITDAVNEAVAAANGN